MDDVRHLCAAALCAVGLLASCGGPDYPRLGTRAVVIGIDGADWKIVDAVAAEGGMPHLSSLRSQGAWGPIETLHDIPLSPVIWTSVATGKTAAEHGVAWFMVDREDGTRAPVRSTNRKTKAIWNVLAEHGRSPTVIGWWATYPAEQIERGRIVSDALGFHGFGATARGGDDTRKTHPASLFREASARVPPEGQISAEFARRFFHMSPEEYAAERFDPACSAQRDAGNPIHLFQEYAATAQGYTSIAEDLLARPYDLFMVYFEQVDSLSHLFMKYAPPKLDWIDEREYARYQDVVAEWYRYQDELLGRLLARIDLDEIAVFILSDHGFKSGDRRIRSERTVDVRRAHLDHETDGIFVAAGPHVRRGASILGASVLDLAPTLLYYLGLPVARDMPGKVLAEVFETDFAQAHPPRYVETYEDGGSRPGAGTPQVADDVSPAEVAEQERTLEALGYLGGSSQVGTESEVSAHSAAGGESSPEIHNNLGRVLLGRGDAAGAQKEFEKALELDPHNAEALLNVGSLKRLAGRASEAEHFVKRALQVDPNSVGALCQLAEIQRDLNDLEESIRLYREALAIDDSQPFVFLGLGDSLQRAGRYGEAERAFRRVLELDPDSFEATYNLGVTFQNQGRLDEALESFETALELNSRHPNAAFALNNLGDVHLRRGERDRAIESFRKAMAAAPRHLESRYNLGSIFLTMGRVDEALPLLEEAAALQPDHEQVQSLLGMTYLRTGRNQDAYRSLLLVRRLYPENWIAPLGLALLHAAAGQEREARELLAEALRLGGEPARAEARAYPILKGLLDTLGSAPGA